MNGRPTTLLTRVLFAAAFVLAGIAGLERLTNVFGYTILNGYAPPPSRLLELAAEALLFVIALELREIREIQKRG